MERQGRRKADDPLGNKFGCFGKGVIHIESGVCQWMYLWNPLDVGYLAGYAADGLVKGKITGKAGDKFVAGKLGEKSVIADGEGTQVMLGDPFKFDAKNIGEWKTVY